MATTVTTAGRPVVGESNWLKALTNWIRNHKQAAAYLAVALVVALALFAWNFLSAKTAERSAGRQIAQGRLALDSKTYPLAASVLSQVAENFSGAHAAQEASILLAQARLAQGQTQHAIEVLQRSVSKADRYFRAQTYGLLGAAYENALRPKDAATAYETAAAAALYPFLRAQFLADAGRAWLAAADTARALVAYRTIVQQLDSTSAVGEAKVRIGELTKGAGAATVAK